jgi:hypothetical protein
MGRVSRERLNEHYGKEVYQRCARFLGIFEYVEHKERTRLDGDVDFILASRLLFSP